MFFSHFVFVRLQRFQNVQMWPKNLVFFCILRKKNSEFNADFKNVEKAGKNLKCTENIALSTTFKHGKLHICLWYDFKTVFNRLEIALGYALFDAPIFL